MTENMDNDEDKRRMAETVGNVEYCEVGGFTPMRKQHTITRI